MTNRTPASPCRPDKDASDSFTRAVAAELTEKALASSQMALQQFTHFMTQFSRTPGLPQQFSDMLELHGAWAAEVRQLVLVSLEANRRAESGAMSDEEARLLQRRVKTSWDSIVGAFEIMQDAPAGAFRMPDAGAPGHA